MTLTGTTQTDRTTPSPAEVGNQVLVQSRYDASADWMNSVTDHVNGDSVAHQKTPAYYILKDGTNYKAINGLTGQEETAWTSTNCSTVFMSAVQNLPGYGGKIQFGQGVFTIPEKMLIQPPIKTIDAVDYRMGVTIAGVNPWSTRLTLAANVNDHMFEYAETEYLYFLNFEHIALFGLSSRQSAGSGIRLSSTTVKDFLMFDVYMEYWKEQDVHIAQCWNSRILSCTLESADKYCIQAAGSDLRISNSKLILTDRAINWYANYSEISNCFFYRCNEYAIELRGSYNSIMNNCFLENGYSAANNYDDIYIHNTAQGRNIISGNTFAGGNKTRYAINISGSSAYNNIISNNQFSGQVTKPVIDLGTASLIRGNSGYIARGEIQTFSGSIATLTENAYNSLDNPFGQNVRLLNLDVYVSTGATATTPNIDCGIGNSATTDYTTLFDDLPGETTGFYRSTITTPGTQTVPQIWESGSGNRYLNLSIKDAAATGMVATYTATVMGV